METVIGRLMSAENNIKEALEILKKNQPQEGSLWLRFVEAVANASDIPNNAKAVCVAQAIRESGRGTSDLAKKAYNFHGMKWRSEMQEIAKPFLIKVPSESEMVEFCKFENETVAVQGWFLFLNRWPYIGWKKYADDPTGLIRHLQNGAYRWAEDDEYEYAVTQLLPEAMELLGKYGWKKKVIPSASRQPSIEIVKNTPNQSQRGASIDMIVLHNTAGKFEGSVEWLCNEAAGASAHLVISREGLTAQLVPFAKKSWHAGNSRVNAKSIGIEIEAYKSGHGMTDIQEKKVISWIRWLMREYGIKAENIGIHRWYRNTDCPVLIWKTDDEFRLWRKKHFGA